MQGPARVNVAVREPQLPLQNQRRPPNSQRIHFEPRFKMDKVNVQMDRIWRWIHIEYQATAIWGAVADTDNFAGGRSCNLRGLHRHIACEWDVLHRVASTFDALCSFPFSCGDCGDFEHHRHPFLQEFCPAEAIGAWQGKKSPGYYSASKIFGPQDALRILYILRDSKIRFYNSIWYHLLPAFVAPDDSGCAHSHRGRTRQGCMMLSVVLGCACWSWIGWIAWTLRQVSKLPSWDHCLSNLEEGIFVPMWHNLSPFWSSQER